ncbi:MAG: rhodanese-like domain-containing protein [Pseudomonadota bacterium]|nr:rhodanese-like domain-containing protein [Pseudomonadota bacterium]
MGVYVIAAAELAVRRDLLVLDVRERAERASGMGWIPGSVCRPPEAPGLAPAWTGGPVAVACLSGRRSTIAAQGLAERGCGEVYDLSGGLLAWLEAGLPVAGADVPTPAEAGQTLSRARVERELCSCFVAEAVLVAVDRDEDGAMALDPLAVVREALSATVGPDPSLTPAQLGDVLERLAAAARAHGHAPATIAANVDRLLRLAHAGAWVV